MCAILLALLFLTAGCSSSTQPFNDTPAIGNLFPSDAAAGGPSFTLNISGTGFIATSAAYWNNVQLTTSFNSNTLQLAATIPASYIASPGVAQVTVVTPTPGGGISNAITFTINDPVPAITSLNPSSTPLNVLPANNVLLVNGTNFIASSTAMFNGAARTTNVVSATQLSLPMTAADVAANNTISVTVSNPGPGGGISNAASFVVGTGHALRLKPSVTGTSVNLPQVVSVSSAAGASNGRSAGPATSADGRFVAFYSTATNLVSSGASGSIFVRDTCLGATGCIPQTSAVDLATDGGAPNGAAEAQVSISADGRFVAFASSATNLMTAGANSSASGTQIYVRDLCAGANAAAGCVPSTQLVSFDAQGVGISGASTSPAVSADGRFVAFVSAGGVFVRDTCAGVASTPCAPTTYSVDAAVGLSLADVYETPAISGDGRYIAFVEKVSAAASSSQVMVADMCLGSEAPSSCRPSVATVSVAAGSTNLSGSNQSPAISADGRFVAFQSQGANGSPEVLLRDTCQGGSAPASCALSTTLLSENASSPAISATGRYVSFTTNPVAGSSASTSAASGAFLNVYDTCYEAPAGCVAGVAALSFTPDAPSLAPLNSDGSSLVFSTSTAITGLPLSGEGDVLQFVLPF